MTRRGAENAGVENAGVEITGPDCRWGDAGVNKVWKAVRIK